VLPGRVVLLVPDVPLERGVLPVPDVPLERGVLPERASPQVPDVPPARVAQPVRVVQLGRVGTPVPGAQLGRVGTLVPGVLPVPDVPLEQARVWLAVRVLPVRPPDAAEGERIGVPLAVQPVAAALRGEARHPAG
jgi:hypothetical protein